MALGKAIGEFSLKAASFTVTPGPGSTFTIHVPALAEVGAERKPDASSVGPPGKESLAQG